MAMAEISAVVNQSIMNSKSRSLVRPLRCRLQKVGLRRGVFSACCLGIAGVAVGAEPVDSNLDSALFTLAQHAKLSMPDATAAGRHGQIATVSIADKEQIPARFDDQDRVLVQVLLDGQNSLDDIANQIESLQGSVLDRNSTYRHGILAAYLPTDQLENLSALPGVRALTMEQKPALRVGTYTSQSCALLQTDVLNNAGLQGDGITIGVLSDSFNTARFDKRNPPATTAEMDVKTGDLPVVNVLQDFGGPGNPGTDEGRAICQIAYDEAPHCNLAFATADVSEIGFANNIIRLRTEANCDVIDDDVGYFEEPVFSDGIVSEAVDKVVNSKTLPGKPVIYTTSAGNDGNNGYRSPYRDLSDDEVRAAGNHGNLKLDVKDPSSPNYLNPALTAGGWHNWNPNGGSEPATAVTVPGPDSFVYNLFLQWDDPFDEDHGVTTNYNFLVFDADGNYQTALSNTTNSFRTQRPFKFTRNLVLGTSYQIAITRTTQTDPKAGRIPKTHQLALYSSLNGLSVLTGKYFQPTPLNVPIIYGHPAAQSSIAVAAYDFNWKPAPPFEPQIENYTTPGPAFIYFDHNNQRLATPETRLKPEVAGADGVITTFFATPGYYNYPFTFFGTSAAGPTVSGVVALMLQAAGGPGSLDLTTVRAALENSATPRTSTPEITQALGAGNGAFVAVSAGGEFFFGPNYLTLNYFGPSGQYIESLTIDGSKPGLLFNTRATQFIIGTTVGLSADDVEVEAPSKSTPTFTLKFKKGVFTSGDSITFTVGQNEAGKFPGLTQSQYAVGVDAEDLGDGATFTAELAGTSKGTVTAPFQNGSLAFGYNQGDGFGLINAVAAVDAVTKASPKNKGVSSK